MDSEGVVILKNRDEFFHAVVEKDLLEHGEWQFWRDTI